MMDLLAESLSLDDIANMELEELASFLKRKEKVALVILKNWLNPLRRPFVTPIVLERWYKTL